MAHGTKKRGRAIDHPPWASLTRYALLSFVVQALGALVIWMLVDDRAGTSWSNHDVEEWVTVNLAMGVVLAAVSGVASRRWGISLAMLGGCVLALVAGGSVFIGYAVVKSA